MQLTHKEILLKILVILKSLGDCGGLKDLKE